MKNRGLMRMEMTLEKSVILTIPQGWWSPDLFTLATVQDYDFVF
jgi:hypothetical protein